MSVVANPTQLFAFQNSLSSFTFILYLSFIYIGHRAYSEPSHPLKTFDEAMKWFNDYYLDGHDFCVGNSLTVADFSLIATVTTIIESGIDMSKYPNITEWVKRCESAMPGYETENGEGAKKCLDKLREEKIFLKTLTYNYF
ncbi:hypothetical protein Avbf_17688 [Armadillidium vulgare]|nr:hypothetical protein Avbf_17688 [Armadillidium vulgare]